MLSQRNITVLTALIGGMTAVSSLLLALDPGPVTPNSGVSLTSLDTRRGPEALLFETESRLRPWQAIVIHDSGSLQGSDASIREAHRAMGKPGLGYHFVINNGTQAQDGDIHIGFRWQHQMDGDYLAGEGAQWFHEHAIGVVLVGDADQAGYTEAQHRELAWLVRQIQARFGIPRDRVYVEVGSTPGEPARHFPYATFAQETLGSDVTGPATTGPATLADADH